jgi:hypothetical protein
MYMVVSTSCDLNTAHGEFAKIEANVEYIQSNNNLILADVMDVNLLVKCSTLCMLNALCLTATYYSSLQKCTLFSGDNSQGTRQVAAFAQVISMVDRGRL